MKITIDCIASEAREAAIIQRLAGRLLDTAEVCMNTRIEGMCCDCLHEREPFCGDYSENVACPDRKEDGSCWAAEQWEQTKENRPS